MLHSFLAKQRNYSWIIVIIVFYFSIVSGSLSVFRVQTYYMHSAPRIVNKRYLTEQLRPEISDNFNSLSLSDIIGERPVN